MLNSKKTVRILAVVLALMLGITVCVSAAPSLFSAYGGYEYNSFKESSEAPVTYLPEKVLTHTDLGLDSALNTPSEMVYDKQDTLYILDSGNGRIIAVSLASGKAVRVIDTFADESGAPLSITGATGMDIGPDGKIYIAATEAQEVWIFDNSGIRTAAIVRPDEALAGTDAPFDVSKIMLGNDGTIYVICRSINTGILTFDSEGVFKSFYGSNDVEATASVIKDYFINKFLTREQRKARRSITPTNFSNMTLDNNNFVYTVKSDTFIFGSSDIVQCLNYSGSTIIRETVTFGELENDSYTYYWSRRQNKFVDVEIDAEGMINILDESYGRVYQYTTLGEFVGAFGSIGTQKGTFAAPAAIESANGKIYVLDSKKNNIACFAPTEYGTALRKALGLRESTDLDARLEAWEQVLKLNSNSTYPYYGIGLVYDEMGEYGKALENFKIAGAQTEYSKAYKQYRKTAIADNIVWIVLVVVAVIAAIILISRALKKKMTAVDGTAYSPLETKWGLPIYTLFHPVDAFDQFKDRKTESPAIATGIIALWFIIDTLSFFFTGFIFNTARVTDFQLLVEIFKTIGIFILFVSANWSMCTLMNGKGTFKEIYCAVAYSLIPYVVSVAIRTVLSNFVTENEGVFLTVITTIGLVWSIALIAFALITLHEYSFMQMLGSVLLTFVAMAVIGFLLVLFYTLMLQVWTFIQSIIEELKIR